MCDKEHNLGTDLLWKIKPKVRFNALKETGSFIHRKNGFFFYRCLSNNHPSLILIAKFSWFKSIVNSSRLNKFLWHFTGYFRGYFILAKINFYKYIIVIHNYLIIFNSVHIVNVHLYNWNVFIEFYLFGFLSSKVFFNQK